MRLGPGGAVAKATGTVHVCIICYRAKRLRRVLPVFLQYTIQPQSRTEPEYRDQRARAMPPVKRSRNTPEEDNSNSEAETQGIRNVC